MSFHAPHQYRIKTGTLKSTDAIGNNGVFFIPNRIARSAVPLRVVASDGLDWDHVSVSLPTRCPTWEEMCFIKAMFWDDEDGVMQLHPPRSQWVNNHSFCLHLWRPVGQRIPMPPSYMVGVQAFGTLV